LRDENDGGNDGNEGAAGLREEGRGEGRRREEDE
jgi:hypothetical protein